MVPTKTTKALQSSQKSCYKKEVVSRRLRRPVCRQAGLHTTQITQNLSLVTNLRKSATTSARSAGNIREEFFMKGKIINGVISIFLTRMKITACIMTFIWGVLMFQLPHTSIIPGSVDLSCAKEKPVESSCSKTKCSKQVPAEQEEDEEDCKTDGCNPLMSCPSGNFFKPIYDHLSFLSLVIKKVKTSLVNDNRVVKQLTECWHPPEMI